MHTLLFLLEIEVVDVSAMYMFFVALGVIGLLLGFWRWWLGSLWLVFPTFTSVFLFASLQREEIDYFYNYIIRDLGTTYILHNFISPILGVGLNLTGIGLGLLRNRKRDFDRTAYANTTCDG